MRLVIFAVRDSATDMFGTPMFLVSAGQAVRSFADEVNRPDKDNQLYTHPSDFSLYELGEFDTGSGQFKFAKDVYPLQIVRGLDVRVKE